MKKVLITTDNFYPRIDGISRFLYEVLKRLQFDFDFTVVCPNFRGDETDLDNVKVIRMPLSERKAGDLPLAKPLKYKIQNAVKECDIVWNQTLGPIGYYGIKYAKRFDKTLISYNHSIEWELFTFSLSGKKLKWVANIFSRILMRWLYNKFDLLMVPSIEEGELLKKNGISVPYKPVYLGVDSEVFKPPKDKMQAKEKLNLERTSFIIGYCGRLGHEKNLITLYRAFLRAKKQIKNLRLMIVGDGIAYYRELFKKNPDVYFMGMQKDVVPFLQAMDVFVLPSLTETTSLATLEAMSCKLPVIVTPVGHINEYITDKKNGLFFPEKNSYVLSKKIELLYSDENLKNKLGENARKTVAEMYSWDKTVSDIKDVLNL